MSEPIDLVVSALQYEGFTAEVIDGKTESVDKRRGRIQKAVNKIAEVTRVRMDDISSVTHGPCAVC
jgi:hypothetical protein